MENRNSQRKRQLKKAKIIHDVGSIPCVIKDLSETGAKLLIKDQFLLPSEFTLHADGNGFQTKCEIVWKQEDLVGVKFTESKKAIAKRELQFVQSSEQIRMNTGHRQTFSPNAQNPQDTPQTSNHLRANQRPFGRR